MATGRMESWFTSHTGDRITTLGHLTIDVGVGPVVVPITTGTSQSFADACSRLQGGVNATSLSGFTVSVTNDTCTISRVGNFTLVWVDTEAQAYFGFASTTYTGAASYTSDTDPSGKITLPFGLDVEFGDVLVRRHTIRQTGASLGTFLARHEIMECRTVVGPDDIAHLTSVLQRARLGMPLRVWLDSTNANAHAWTSAGWTGYRDYAIHDPGQELRLTDWQGNDNQTVYRNVTFTLVEVS